MKKYIPNRVCRELSKTESHRVEAVWRRLRFLSPKMSKSLESFERSFMKDVTPMREVAVWENIVTAAEKTIANANPVAWENLSTYEQDKFKSEVAVHCLLLTLGNYTEKQILSDNLLSHCAFELFEARKDNPARPSYLSGVHRPN